MQTILDLCAGIYARLGILKRRRVRWLIALSYTVFVTVLLVQSSSQPLIGPASPPGPPDLPRELLLSLGHVAVFFMLVILWWWALVGWRTSQQALFVAVGFALVTGLLTESAQSLVVDRQASLFDLAVNWTATIAAACLIAEQVRRRQRLPGL